MKESGAFQIAATLCRLAMDVYEVQFMSGPLVFCAQRAAENRPEHLRPLLNKHASEDRIGVACRCVAQDL